MLLGLYSCDSENHFMHQCSFNLAYRLLLYIVLLKALLTVIGLKYASQDESPMANIERENAECYICHKTLPRAVYCKQSGSALSVLLYFTLKELLTKYTSLKFNALSANLRNKPMVSFD